MSAAVILCIDDQPANRYWLTRTLDAGGFEVRTAATGAEGVAAAHAGVDLVVLDVHLPDISGLEVCRRLKADAATRALPVLHLSAEHVRAHDRVASLSGGADAFLVQPVQPDELVATVRALLRMRDAEERARRAADEWAVTFDAIQEAVVVASAGGTVLRCNRAFARLVGAPLEEIVGGSYERALKQALQEKSVEPGEVVTHLEAAEGILPALEALRGRVEREAVANDRSYLITADPIWEGARLVRAVITVADVTARRQLADQQASAREYALRVVAHDLRSPLSVLMLNASRLLRDFAKKPTDPRYSGWVETMQRSGERMAHLVSGMLDLARMESGRLPLSPQPGDVDEFLREMVDPFEVLAQQRGIRFKVSATPGVRAAYDRERLAQVFSNLVGNALKYTPEGGEVHVSATRVAGEVEFAVADTGAGIAPDNLPHIFERYWQARETGRQGIGLGLSIAKGIVEAHGGRIWAASTLGKGTTLSFSLPAA